MSGLAAFSTDQLLAEIVRRRNAEVSRQPIVKCDECRHFVFFAGRGDPSDNYNPCAKRHVMSFRQPSDDGPPDQGDDWGYYRRVCADREGRPDVRSPLPPARVLKSVGKRAPPAPGSKGTIRP